MNRIPVAETIRFAYSFAFGQIGAIIGLVWLPLLIAALLQFLPYAIGTAYPPDATNAAQSTESALLNLMFAMGSLVLYAMNCVSVTRQALGLRQGAASIHFSLARPEGRMFAAIVICGLIVVSAVLLCLLVGTISDRLTGASAILVSVAILAGLCAIVWFTLRLVFFVPSVVVAEERVDLARAWTLSRQNFWRILAVVLAATVPILLLQGAALLVVLGPAFVAPLPANTAAATVAFTQRLAMLDRHMPTVIGLTLVLTPFNLGLTLGASAFAYRSLVPAKPSIRSS
ncbi:MAG TPA: hypothetical protein VGI20_03480 [Rhizomicrobium sp.]|jgi:hypothetical protein